MNAKERTEKLVKSVIEAKEARIATVEKDHILKYRDGFTIKQLCEDAHLIPKTARNYIHELMDEGRVKDTGDKTGRAPVYIHTDFLNDAQEQAIEEAQTAKETEKKEDVVAGREFKDSRSITSVVTGDVSWISSRSGNGLFFRYLILAVHPYKATCANVFPEGHEAVNVNDPNFIYIGQEPENKVRLYVDLTNICQRRFSAFGERCMHIAPDRMEAVTKRLARLFKIEMPKCESELETRFKDISKQLKESIAREGYAAEGYKQLKESCDKLTTERDHYKSLHDELKRNYQDLYKAHENLRSLCENPKLREDYESLLKERKADVAAIDSLSNELNRLTGVENYAKGLEDEIEELKEELEAYKGNEPKIPTDVYLQAEVTRLRSLMASERRHNHDLMVLASAMAGVKYICTGEVDDGEEESGEA